MIFGNIIFISYFYGINPAQAENPIFFLLSFRDPNDVQITCKFTSVNIWKDQDLGRRKRTNGAPRPKRGGPTWPLYLAAWDPSSGASTLHCRRSFLLRPSRDLKTPIKITPRRSLEGAPPKHRNTETEIWS